MGSFLESYNPDLGFAGRRVPQEGDEIIPHVPLESRRRDLYGEGKSIDERGFLYSGPPLETFEKEIAQRYLRAKQYIEKDSGGINCFKMDQNAPAYRRVVEELSASLNRAPLPAEVERECYRQRGNSLQVEMDFYHDPSSINKAEIFPQNEVIKKRQDENQFPDPENALKAFRDGAARIEERDGIKWLIISVPNKDGKMIDHPVMTTEELWWVKDSAKAIAASLNGKKDAKVFIAGLGLGLLNRELVKLGIENQVVAEINTQVIELITKELEKEYPGMKLEINDGGAAEGAAGDAKAAKQSTVQSKVPLNLNIRQGDFKQILVEAIERGEQFDAISIDAFPNTADEINRDASNATVFELAYKALKPGGMITFYPDSRYLPPRIRRTLSKMGVPDSSVHYMVSKFETSEFTKSYHYGELMAVPMIQKPLLGNDESGKAEIKKLVEQYYETLDEQARSYVDKYLAEPLYDEAA